MTTATKGAALVLNVEPNWIDHFDNRPDFRVLLGYVPMHDEYLHATDGKGHYRGQIDDSVHYMYSDGQPTHGYGGRHIKLKMAGGETREFIGGWSSNAATINSVFPKADAIIECSVTDDPEVMIRGHTFYSGAVTVDSILTWWLTHQRVDWGLAMLYDEYSVWLEPTKGRFIKWGNNLNVAIRFFPQPDYADQGYCDRVHELFWKTWRKLQVERRGGGDLSGEQMAAVRA